MRPGVSATPSEQTVDLGDRVQVAGVVSPADAVGVVRLQRRAAPAWVHVVGTASVGSDGGYAVRWDARAARAGSSCGW